MSKPSSSPKVSIIMGSDSDLPVMKGAAEALDQLGIPYEISVLSAHRTPHETIQFAESARKRGVRVIIAGAGGAAHLGGVVAAITELPVIGVPIASGILQGQDSLLSIVQMPKGVPVACVAISNAWNAGVLATQILGAGDSHSGAILDKITEYKQNLRINVLAKKVELTKK